jgi:hypothetical protein
MALAIEHSSVQDASLLEVVDEHGLPRWNKIGKPDPGGYHYWWEYTFDDQSNSYRRKFRRGKWLREYANNIVLEGNAIPGASGSCLFNDKGEAVGLVVAASEELNITVAIRFIFDQAHVDTLNARM